MTRLPDSSPPSGIPPDRFNTRLADGWMHLAFSFGRAMTAALGGYEGVVMWAVIEGSWGTPWLRPRSPGSPPPDPEWVKLNCAELARQTGLHETRLVKAKKRLITEGLLLEEANGYLLPCKNFASWDKTFLTKGDMERYSEGGADVKPDIRSGDCNLSARSGGPGFIPNAPPRRARSGGKPSDLRAVRSDENHSDPCDENHSDPQRKSDGNPSENPALSYLSLETESSKQSGQFAPARPRVIRPDEDGGRPRSGSTAPPVSVAVSACKPLPPVVEPVDADGYGELTGLPASGSHPGRIQNDPAELDRVKERVEAWYPCADLGAFVELHKNTFPAAWFLRLIKRHKVQKKPTPNRALLHKILCDWHAQGGPEIRVEANYDDADVPDLLPASQMPVGDRRGNFYERTGAAPPPVAKLTNDELARQKARDEMTRTRNEAARASQAPAPATGPRLFNSPEPRSRRAN